MPAGSRLQGVESCCSVGVMVVTPLLAYTWYECALPHPSAQHLDMFGEVVGHINIWNGIAGGTGFSSGMYHHVATVLELKLTGLLWFAKSEAASNWVWGGGGVPGDWPWQHPHSLQCMYG
jgi:hypothetical protein